MRIHPILVRRRRCITFVRRTSRLLAVRMNLWERSRATPMFQSSCSTGSRVRGRGLTVILMMRFSSSVKDAECGRSTAKLSKRAREIFLLLRPARFTASKRLGIRRWCRWIFISARGSFRRICRASASPKPPSFARLDSRGRLPLRGHCRLLPCQLLLELFHPSVYLLFKNSQRKRAFEQKGIVECAEIERLTHFFLGLRAHVFHSQLADLVGQRLPRPGDVAINFSGRVVF